MRQTRFMVSFAALCLLCGARLAPAAEVKPLEQLLPETTAAAVFVPSVERLIDGWNATQLGELAKQPVMKPFADDIRRQFEDRWSGVRDRLGLSLDDLRHIPSGEVAAVVIRPAPDEVAHAVLADVTGREAQARETLDRVAKNLLRQGAKRKQQSASGQTLDVFELPPKDDQARRADGTAEGAAERRVAAYALAGNLLVATDSVVELERILARNGGTAHDSLAELTAFKSVMQRCQSDAADAKPQLRWFIVPLKYAETMRTVTPERERRKGKSRVELLQDQGFDALQGIGGYLDFKPAEGFEIVHRTAVYAPPPYEKSMKMLKFPAGDDFQPQAWVPPNIATYTTMYFDVVNAFDNFGSLFDDLFGQGETGVWDDVKESMRIDPNGPQIDLRQELIQHLGPRVSIITDYELPITPTSERLLFAIEAHDAEAVAAAVDKIMADENAEQREIEGHKIWEVVEEDSDVPQLPVVALPSITPGQAPPSALVEEAETKEARLLPHAAVTVANGHLLYASHLDFLLRILRNMDAGEKLFDNPNYQLVERTIDSQGLKDLSARAISFTDNEYRATYELIRQNKMPESETMLARVLNSFSPSTKRGELRKPQIDGKELPPFEAVQGSLGPAGMAICSERDGWFLKGFTLTKPKPAAQAAEAQAAPAADGAEKAAEETAKATESVEAVAPAPDAATTGDDAEVKPHAE